MFFNNSNCHQVQGDRVLAPQKNKIFHAIDVNLW